MADFSHLTADGTATMVDVGGKPETRRTAVARVEVRLAAATMALLLKKALPKGDVLSVARVAGILAAKKTAELIPLCHPLPLDFVDVRFEVNAEAATLRIETEARTSSRTGVEMEALTAAQIAALTVYDMCKAVQKDIVITDCRLIKKTGGKSGEYNAPA